MEYLTDSYLNAPMQAFEIYYYSLDGEFKKVPGMFSRDERNTLMDAMHKANYERAFCGAMYGVPQGQFTQPWTLAEEVPGLVAMAEPLEQAA